MFTLCLEYKQLNSPLQIKETQDLHMTVCARVRMHTISFIKTSNVQFGSIAALHMIVLCTESLGNHTKV